MTDRNINNVKLDVIMDQFGVYPSGCSKMFECANLQNWGTFKIVTDTYIDPNTCGGMIDAGTIYPVDYVTPATTVPVVKVKNGDLGFSYISQVSFEAGLEECNGCCIPMPQLATPASFVGTPGDTQVAADWANVTDATGYVLQRSPDSNFNAPTTVYSGAASNYTNTGLVNGTIYYYRVKATAPNFADSEWAYMNATPVAP